jgi:hypothetical protein
MSLSNWRWYHVVIVWIVATATCVAASRRMAQVVEGKSDSGGIVGVGVPLSLIVIYAVVLVALIVITVMWVRGR